METTATTSTTLQDLMKPVALGKNKKELSQEDFLKIMLKQLEQQDPTSPQDANQFATQFAQFGTVNGINELQKSFAELSASMRTGQATQALSLVGRGAQVSGNKAYLDAQQGLRGSVVVPGNSGEITVNITDQSGSTVKQIKLLPNGSEQQEIIWDGKLANGDAAKTGNYTLHAMAKVDGTSTALATYGVQKIDSISIEQSGNVKLNLANSATVNLNDIKKFY